MQYTTVFDELGRWKRCSWGGRSDEEDDVGEKVELFRYKILAKELINCGSMTQFDLILWGFEPKR